MNPLIRRFWYLYPSILAAGCILLSSQVASADMRGEVVEVLDGDTIDIMIEGDISRVRLSQIDAPEKSQSWGNESREFLTDIVGGRTVTVQGDTKDQYGRVIGDVYIQAGCITIDCPPPMSVNRLMVRRGLAWVYRQYLDDESYLVVERKARDARVGLWSLESPIPPWEYRHQ